MHDSLSLENIRATASRLVPYIVTTPAHRWQGIELHDALQTDATEVYVKLELLQRTGTFKPRGALNVMLALSDEQLGRGVTAVSAGNHAIATAFAAAQLGTTAKVVMTRTANPLRVSLSQQYGAEVVFADNPHQAFEMVRDIEAQEGRSFVHPFEGPLTLQGTATAGLEFTEQVPPLDAMLLPIGGGGLCGGFAAALKQVWPEIKIYGVEPQGANAMYRSFASGEPETLEQIDTIADSLAPPKAEPFTFAVCREVVDEIVLVSDQQLRDAMRLLFLGLKLAVEPAGAATTAALISDPLRERLQGKRVGIIACGANISPENFYQLISACRE